MLFHELIIYDLISSPVMFWIIFFFMCLLPRIFKKMRNVIPTRILRSGSGLVKCLQHDICIFLELVLRTRFCSQKSFFLVKTGSKFWRRHQGNIFFALQDDFNMSSRRICNDFSWRCIDEDALQARLEDVLRAFWRILKDVLKTSCFLTFQDIFKTCLQDVFQRCLLDVFERKKC